MFQLFKKKKRILFSPQKGNIIQLEDVPDTVFAQKLLGEGFAIIPESGKLYSPVSGKVKLVSQPSFHAYGIETLDKVSVLIHMGIDTIELKGQGFKTFVKEGETVKQGDLLGQVDLDLLAEKGYHNYLMVTITNSSECLESYELVAQRSYKVGTEVFQYTLK